MVALSDRLDFVIGRTSAKKLEEYFGIRTVNDLLRHYPRKYNEGMTVRGEGEELVLGAFEHRLHLGELPAQHDRDGVELLRRREKDAEISQDEQRKLQHDVQHLTDDYVKRIDEALAQKDREILQV